MCGRLSESYSLHRHRLSDSHRLVMSFARWLIDALVAAEWLSFHPLKDCLHHSCTFLQTTAQLHLTLCSRPHSLGDYHSALICQVLLSFCSGFFSMLSSSPCRRFLCLLNVNMNRNDQWDDLSFISFRMWHITYILGWTEWPTNGSTIGCTWTIYSMATD